MRLIINGEYQNQIITTGAFDVIKSIKGNVKNKGNSFEIAVGEISLFEWLKGEKDPEAASKQLTELGIYEDYYISYEIDGFVKKHIVAGEKYLAFFNYTERSEYDISPFVLYKAKQENGVYVIKNETTDKYEPLENYLPKEVSK